jgi:hypothetical protein
MGECAADEAKYTCGEPMPEAGEAAYGNNSLPEWSTLSGDSRCDDADKAVRELYGQVSSIKERIDLSALRDCMGIDTEDATPGTVMNMLAGRLCALMNRYNALRAAYEGLPECECGGDGCL